ncbi:MAG: alpha/beta fold hydrolase [Saprospiraceae bacterium]
MEKAQRIKKPSVLSFLDENRKVWIALWQAYTFRKTHQTTAKGDGHPVLVLPGFMASDLSSFLLRRFIKEQGYVPYPWGLGRNYGDLSQLNTLLTKIETLQAKHQTQVSLIGWSLGGVYARQLAKERPDLVRQVITLAAPFAGIDQPNNAAWLHKLINYRSPIADADQKWLVDLAGPAPVPTTALYSKDDGVVPWQACMEPIEDALHQNVEIKGGHFGMGYLPSTWLLIADRLQLTAANWKPFFP